MSDGQSHLAARRAGLGSQQVEGQMPRFTLRFNSVKSASRLREHRLIAPELPPCPPRNPESSALGGNTGSIAAIRLRWSRTDYLDEGDDRGVAQGDQADALPA